MTPHLAISLGLLALLLLAAGTAAYHAWHGLTKPLSRPPRKRKPRPQPKNPVVLAHGLFGFDQVELAGKRIEYFREVPKKLRKMGLDVHVARVSPVGDVVTRASQLAEQIEAIPAKKVNVIAHSMGGIDARYAISRLGISGKVASLTTIGTPHRGTPIADYGSKLTHGKYGVAKAFGGFGLPLGGIEDATTTKMGRFNRRVHDVPGVHYASCVANVAGGVRAVSTMLVPSYLFLAGFEGENDGIVPSASQQWGNVLAHIDADHWAQVGWTKKFDAPAFYAALMSELRGRGL